MHIPIPSTLLFPIMGAISQESMRKSTTQLTAKAKQPHQEATFRVAEDAAYASLPLSSSIPSSTSGVEAFLSAILDQLLHMRVHFGGHLDYLSDEMCQMNTRIGCIACRQSRLGGFLPSLDHDPSKESSNDGDDDGDDASSSNYNDDEMTISQ